MTNDSISVFEAIRIAAHNYVDTPTLVAAGRVQTADLTRAKLVMLVAGFAGLTAGVVQTRRAEREAVITAPAPAPHTHRQDT